VRRDKEQKIFLAVLWCFLVGSIIFFTAYLSIGRIFLPLPVIVTFLLLDVGFIVFIFIPHPGRTAPGPPEKMDRTDRWYPQKLEEIIERTDKPELPPSGGLRAIVRTIAPIPLLPLLLLVLVILLAIPVKPSEEKWRGDETGRLTVLYQHAESEMLRLESLGRTLGERAGTLLGTQSLSGMQAHERAVLVHGIDSIANSVGWAETPLHEIGIQIFSDAGERFAWGGRPRYVYDRPVGKGSARVFIHRTQLYTLLVYDMPIHQGRVVTDIPLEVNYRISNQFLVSTSLGEILSRESGKEIDFSFAVGEHQGDAVLAGKVAREAGANVIYDRDTGVQAYGNIIASTGLAIARLRIKGEPYYTILREVESQRTFWARLVITLIVAIIAIWGYRTYGKRRILRGPRLWSLAKRIAVLVFFCAVIRYLLLKLDFPSGLFGVNLFDPALFADDLPGGLLRTVGDFLITSIFALIIVFGSIKAFRTFYPGYLERPLSGERSFSWIRFIAKTAVLSLVLAIAIAVSGNLVSRIVINSNPRLVGLDIDFLEVPVTVLHLAMLFAVSAVFISALFLGRLVFVWRRGGGTENLWAAGAAVAACLFIFKFFWIPVAAAAGLLLLAARIFPLLKKEEVISVIFASFFLVLISALVIDGVAWSKYAELRKSRVLEKAQDFLNPDENWLEIVLPDLCQDISADRNVASRVLTSENSVAFEIWAESALSRFNLSCMTEVFDAAGERFSRFGVGMPFEPPPAEPSPPGQVPGISVSSLQSRTRQGTVFFYRGVAPVYHGSGRFIGRVEITIPYFFDNPALLARTGPMAPEILHNIERGALAPRVDEPEDLLVARIDEGRVTESSTPLLLAGTPIGASGEEWFELDLERSRYSCVIRTGDDGTGFLVGYRAAGALENLFRWAMLVSLDIMLTVVALAVLLLLRKLPILGSVTPAVSLAGGLGFRQKILLSFLVVSILPVVILGLFSGRFIERRFREEGEKEALSSVEAAVSLLDHSIVAEAEAFAGSQYLSDILSGARDARIRDVAFYEQMQFTLFDGDGKLLLDESLSDFRPEEMIVFTDGSNIGRMMVSFEHPHLFGGIVIPLALPGDSGGRLYYRRRLDDDFIASVADVLGRDINIYYRGRVRASSERELFTGGFLEPLLAPGVFADVALNNSQVVVREALLGDYSYHVASRPLAPVRRGESGVLSVPMLYQPALVEKEILRTSSLILGLLALIFAAAVTLGFFLAGQIFNPIAALRGGTRRIIEGDLEFRLESRAPDEIGELVDSFNTMTGALRDARRDLLERQRYLAAILDNVATGVMTADRDGKIITLNPSGERILGLEKRQVLGKKPEEVEEKQLEPLFRLMSSGDRMTREREVSFRSGDASRTIKAMVTGLGEGDERLGTVVVFDDLTELIRSKKLSAWIEMARQIAHEVKNPLTPIRLSVQLMRRAYEEGREEFGEIFTSGVDTVVQQTEILRRIASEFSSFGKVTSLELETVSLASFLREFVASYRGAEGVEINLVEGADVKVRADREALRKILVNLMENALEAMTGGGEVTIDYARSDDIVSIRVLDTGSGLSPEIIEKLFEPYFSTKTNGTGLGLAICRNLAHEMDGDIVLQNRRETTGVEAVVTLPASDG
jgi:PAS domain S-box-containing protein